ncbi:MAG TPA: hypothetical protein VH253_15595 [Phycisphaerae bacterium]|nr:hypothetical protein [Phycisphaerae bacterium]
MQEPMNEANGGVPEELEAFQRRLAGLRPAATSLDRDRVLFESGRAAGMAGATRARWAWRAGAIGGWAAAACVAVALWPHGGGGGGGVALPRGGLADVQRPPAQSVASAAQAQSPPREPAPWLLALLPQPSPAWRERNLILSRGVDALPEMPASNGHAAGDVGPAADPLPESYRIHPLFAPVKGARS